MFFFFPKSSWILRCFSLALCFVCLTARAAEVKNVYVLASCVSSEMSSCSEALYVADALSAVADAADWVAPLAGRMISAGSEVRHATVNFESDGIFGAPVGNALVPMLILALCYGLFLLVKGEAREDREEAALVLAD